MINVLIAAYAVSPNWGSEPGMGWNWVINIARYCNVHVITEGEWRNEIEEAVERLPQKDNLHFYYNPLPERVRQMCWNQGDWRFYWYYRKWAKRTLTIARDIIARNHIDVVHQLNMIGFREPGYLWRIKELPMVWGPIGGMGSIPIAYLKGAGLKYNLFFRLKNVISNLQLRFQPRVRAAAHHATMIAATSEVQRKVKQVYGKDIPLINETGLYVNDYSENQAIQDNQDSRRLRVIWIGRFIFTKRLDIALKAVAATDNPNIELTVCGTGGEEEVSGYNRMAVGLGIASQVRWLGKVDHNQIDGLMKQADCLLFTSVAEATSTVVLEAIAAGLPIISFNACGFGSIVNNFAGKTIELSTPEQSIKDFADALNYFSANRDELYKITQSQISNRHTLSWEHKGQAISATYSSLSGKWGG